MKKILYGFMAAAMLIAIDASAQVVLQRAVVSQSGGTATNGSTVLQYTVSQPVVGKATNNQTVGQFGFWNARTGIAGVHTGTAGSLQAITLSQNPAQGNITISVSLTQTQDLELALYDDAGKQIQTIYTGKATTGGNSYQLNTTSLASGAYFVAAIIPGAMLQTKLTVVK